MESRKKTKGVSFSQGIGLIFNSRWIGKCSTCAFSVGKVDSSNQKMESPKRTKGVTFFNGYVLFSILGDLESTVHVHFLMDRWIRQNGKWKVEKNQRCKFFSRDRSYFPFSVIWKVMYMCIFCWIGGFVKSENGKSKKTNGVSFSQGIGLIFHSRWFWKYYHCNFGLGFIGFLHTSFLFFPQVKKVFIQNPTSFTFSILPSVSPSSDGLVTTSLSDLKNSI